MIGGSIDGYSRTPRKSKPMPPNTMMTMDITIAMTGRLRLTEERLIAGLLPIDHVHAHGHIRPQLHDPTDEHGIARLQAGGYLHSAVIAQTYFDLHRCGLAATTEDHLLPAQLGDHGLRGHHQGAGDPAQWYGHLRERTRK